MTHDQYWGPDSNTSSSDGPSSASAAASAVYQEQEKEAKRVAEEARRLARAQLNAEPIEAVLIAIAQLKKIRTDFAVRAHDDCLYIHLNLIKNHKIMITVEYDDYSITDRERTDGKRHRELYHASDRLRPYEVRHAGLQKTLQALAMLFGTYYPEHASEIDAIILATIRQHAPGVSSHGWPVGEIIPSFPALNQQDLRPCVQITHDSLEAELAAVTAAHDIIALKAVVSAGDKLFDAVHQSFDRPTHHRTLWQRILRRTPANDSIARLAADMKLAAAALPNGVVKDACLLYAESAKTAFYLGRAFHIGQQAEKQPPARRLHLRDRMCEDLTTACALSGHDAEHAAALAEQALSHHSPLDDKLLSAIKARFTTTWRARSPFDTIDGFIAGDTGLGASLAHIHDALLAQSDVTALQPVDKKDWAQKKLTPAFQTLTPPAKEMHKKLPRYTNWAGPL